MAMPLIVPIRPGDTCYLACLPQGFDPRETTGMSRADNGEWQYCRPGEKPCVLPSDPRHTVLCRLLHPVLFPSAGSSPDLAAWRVRLVTTPERQERTLLARNLKSLVPAPGSFRVGDLVYFVQQPGTGADRCVSRLVRLQRRAAGGLCWVCRVDCQQQRQFAVHEGNLLHMLEEGDRVVIRGLPSDVLGTITQSGGPRVAVSHNGLRWHDRADLLMVHRPLEAMAPWSPCLPPRPASIRTPEREILLDGELISTYKPLWLRTAHALHRVTPRLLNFICDESTHRSADETLFATWAAFELARTFARRLRHDRMAVDPVVQWLEHACGKTGTNEGVCDLLLCIRRKHRSVYVNNDLRLRIGQFVSPVPSDAVVVCLAVVMLKLGLSLVAGFGAGIRLLRPRNDPGLDFLPETLFAPHESRILRYVAFVVLGCEGMDLRYTIMGLVGREPTFTAFEARLRDAATKTQWKRDDSVAASGDVRDWASAMILHTTGGAQLPQRLADVGLMMQTKNTYSVEGLQAATIAAQYAMCYDGSRPKRPCEVIVDDVVHSCPLCFRDTQ